MNVKHLAIIMDGNGRWAKARGKVRTEGHFRGVEVVRDAAIAANIVPRWLLSLQFLICLQNQLYFAPVVPLPH